MQMIYRTTTNKNKVWFDFYETSANRIVFSFDKVDGLKKSEILQDISETLKCMDKFND